MKLNLNLHKYVDWKVQNVMPIKGKYGFRVILFYMDGSQHPQQKSGFATEKEAQAARERTIGELYSNTYIVYSNVTVAEFLESWLEEDVDKRIENFNTYENYCRTVRKHIIPMIGKKKMVELTRGDVQELYNQTAAQYTSTARAVKSLMNISMRYAVDKKVIANNPEESVDLPRAKRKQPFHTRSIDVQKTLTIEQVLLLIEESKKSPIYLQVLFNVLMGLRRQEIIGVKYSDIDFINRTLSLKTQLGQKRDRTGSGRKSLTKQDIKLKTKSSKRVIPIPDLVLEAILEERELYEKHKRRRKQEFQDLGYVCCSTYGRPRSKDFHWSYYKQLLKDCGLPDIRWHDLRATFCTILLKSDFNPKAVAKLMGHAKEIVTIDVYGDNRQIIQDCVTEIESFIEEMMDIDEVERIDTADGEYLINVQEYIA